MLPLLTPVPVPLELGLVVVPPTTPPLVPTPVPPGSMLRCELVLLEPVVPVPIEPLPVLAPAPMLEPVPVAAPVPEDIVPVALEPMLFDCDGRTGVLPTVPGTGDTEPPPLTPWPAQEPALGVPVVLPVVPAVPVEPLWVAPIDELPIEPVALDPVADEPVADEPVAEPPEVVCAKATLDRAARMVAVRICLRMIISLML